MEDELYTVLKVVRGDPVRWNYNTKRGLLTAPPGRFYFYVYYNTRTRNNRSVTVEARDELEAFMLGSKQIEKNKAKSERMQAAKQVTSTS